MSAFDKTARDAVAALSAQVDDGLYRDVTVTIGRPQSAALVTGTATANRTFVLESSPVVPLTEWQCSFLASGAGTMVVGAFSRVDPTNTALRSVNVPFVAGLNALTFDFELNPGERLGFYVADKGYYTSAVGDSGGYYISVASGWQASFDDPDLTTSQQLQISFVAQGRAPAEFQAQIDAAQGAIDAADQTVVTGAVGAGGTSFYNSSFVAGPLEPAPGGLPIATMLIRFPTSGAGTYRAYNVDAAGKILAMWADFTSVAGLTTLTPGVAPCPIPADYAPPDGTYIVFGKVSGTNHITYTAATGDTRQYDFNAAAVVGDTLTGALDRTGFRVNVEVTYAGGIANRLGGLDSKVATARARIGGLEASTTAIESRTPSGLPIFFGGQYNYKLRFGLGKIHAVGGGGLVAIAVAGDSLHQRPGLTTPFREQLYARHGKAGHGWINIDTANPTDYTTGYSLTRSAGWTFYDANDKSGVAPPLCVGADGMCISTAGTTETATLNFIGTKLHIQHGRFGGTFEYQLDGGSWVAVAADSAGTLAAVNLTGLAAGAHVLNIRTTANTGTVAIVGFAAWGEADNGVIVSNHANRGMNGIDYTAIKTWVTASLALLPFDLAAVQIVLGTNDSRTGKTLASYTTGVVDLFAAYTARWADISRIKVTPYQHGATDATSMASIRDADFAAAKAGGYAWYNGKDDWGTYAQMNALGAFLSGDNLHCNISWGQAIASELIDEFY
ncbi:hypothetical protein AYR46_02935 [Sphingobium yanoikuyae]|uniref:hypothetical protein n=1 Tax=Sphingobium yanoikuyae TaxID=13690 RepID=UPI0007A74ABE|nr:hypothetical protein [Sphingobium yanoikuyae]KZC82876.1 hypothetical protein AYR46_02935 [Sphingobium yanoikuyae]